MMVTRSYGWPRYFRRLWRRVPFLVDPVTRTLVVFRPSKVAR
jgi:hypothetical protein